MARLFFSDDGRHPTLTLLTYSITEKRQWSCQREIWLLQAYTRLGPQLGFLPDRGIAAYLANQPVPISDTYNERSYQSQYNYDYRVSSIAKFCTHTYIAENTPRI